MGPKQLGNLGGGESRHMYTGWESGILNKLVDLQIPFKMIPPAYIMANLQSCFCPVNVSLKAEFSVGSESNLHGLGQISLSFPEAQRHIQMRNS